jgi:hypothetical protein
VTSRVREPPGRRGTSPTSAGAIAILVILGALMVAVGSPTASAAGPSLTILSPANDEVIGHGASVIVRFAVSNFTLVQPGRFGEGPNATEGHIDLFVDGGYSRLLTRVEPISLALGSGPHEIHLQLVHNNGTPLSPDVSASVRVLVTQGPAVGTPTIRIVSPKPDEVTGHDVYFAVEVTNFGLVDAHGQPNAPNEGHVQLLLNGIFQQEPRAYDVGFLVDLPDGSNTVTARLVNNDNSPLNPDVFANVTIRIRGAADPTASGAVTGGISILLSSILILLMVRRRRAAAHFANRAASKP